MRSIVATCILALQPFAASGAYGQVDDPIPAKAVAATDTIRTATVVESTLVAPSPSPSPQEAWKSFRFRGGPKEVCGAFALTEYCLLWRADGGSDVSADERTYESFDLGAAKNVGKAMALGVTLFAGGDGVRTQRGARARGRIWISPSVSFDVSPGLVLWGEEEGGSSLAGPEPIVQAGLDIEDRIAVVGQVFHTRRSDGATDETAWLLGARFGSEPGMAALLIAFVVGVIHNAAGN